MGKAIVNSGVEAKATTGMEDVCGGMCPHCGKVHRLEQGPAREASLHLMQLLAVTGRIDLFSEDSPPDSACSTVPLFGHARGKMFGVLTGNDVRGKEVVVYAFSGQFNGRWSVPGWAEPVFDLDAFYLLTSKEEREIKQIGRRMEEHRAEPMIYSALKRARKQKSRQLMTRIHRLYTLRNFHGRTMPLVDLFPGSGEPPTGTGDCCAPKLLNHAVSHNISPTGLVEFYWGRENRSRSREHGCFYPPCSTKCEPILGFLLCGCNRSQGG